MQRSVGGARTVLALCVATAFASVQNWTQYMNGRKGWFAGLYDCTGNPGEAYSAAYFGTKATFLEHPVPPERLSGGQGNMEGASHTVFRKKMLVKTVDMFDFYVEHLSWYERRLLKGAKVSREGVLLRLKGQTAHRRRQIYRLREDVVAVMPFYATAGGDSGHSALESRRVFLNLTHESLQLYFKNIVACVATDFDRDYLHKESGLDFFDVMKADVFRPSRLGFATVHHAQMRLLHDPKWKSISYLYYTESDQIFHARSFDRLLAIADAIPRVWVIPHRVMPAPLRQDLGRSADFHPDALREFGRNGAKSLSTFSADRADRGVSCCFDRGKCESDRSHWKPFVDKSVELFQLAPDTRASRSEQNSFALVAGEGNFLKQHFRTCVLNTTARTFC